MDRTDRGDKAARGASNGVPALARAVRAACDASRWDAALELFCQAPQALMAPRVLAAGRIDQLAMHALVHEPDSFEMMLAAGWRIQECWTYPAIVRLMQAYFTPTGVIEPAGGLSAAVRRALRAGAKADHPGTLSGSRQIWCTPLTYAIYCIGLGAFEPSAPAAPGGAQPVRAVLDTTACLVRAGGYSCTNKVSCEARDQLLKGFEHALHAPDGSRPVTAHLLQALLGQILEVCTHVHQAQILTQAARYKHPVFERAALGCIARADLEPVAIEAARCLRINRAPAKAQLLEALVAHARLVAMATPGASATPSGRKTTVL